MKEDVWKSFFRKFADWHLATSLPINFFTDNFQGFWINEGLQMVSSHSCIKYLKSTCEMLFTGSGGWNSATCSLNKQFPRDAL